MHKYHATVEDDIEDGIDHKDMDDLMQRLRPQSQTVEDYSQRVSKLMSERVPRSSELLTSIFADAQPYSASTYDADLRHSFGEYSLQSFPFPPFDVPQSCSTSRASSSMPSPTKTPLSPATSFSSTKSSHSADQERRSSTISQASRTSSKSAQGTSPTSAIRPSLTRSASEALPSKQHRVSFRSAPFKSPFIEQTDTPRTSYHQDFRRSPPRPRSTSSPDTCQKQYLEAFRERALTIPLRNRYSQSYHGSPSATILPLPTPNTTKCIPESRRYSSSPPPTKNRYYKFQRTQSLPSPKPSSVPSKEEWRQSLKPQQERVRQEATPQPSPRSNSPTKTASPPRSARSTGTNIITVHPPPPYTQAPPPSPTDSFLTLLNPSIITQIQQTLSSIPASTLAHHARTWSYHRTLTHFLHPDDSPPTNTSSENFIPRTYLSTGIRSYIRALAIAIASPPPPFSSSHSPSRSTHTHHSDEKRPSHHHHHRHSSHKSHHNPTYKITLHQHPHQPNTSRPFTPTSTSTILQTWIFLLRLHVTYLARSIDILDNISIPKSWNLDLRPSRGKDDPTGLRGVESGYLLAEEIEEFVSVGREKVRSSGGGRGRDGERVRREEDRLRGKEWERERERGRRDKRGRSGSGDLIESLLEVVRLGY